MIILSNKPDLDANNTNMGLENVRDVAERNVWDIKVKGDMTGNLFV